MARIDWFFGIPWFLRPSRIGGRNSLVLGLTLGFSLSLSLTGLAIYARDAWKRSIRKKAEKRLIEVKGEEIVDGVEGLIGEYLAAASSRAELAQALRANGAMFCRKHAARTNQLAQ